MSGFKSKSNHFGESSSSPSKNPMSKISKKGSTLGAQHASHGDDGAERLVRKPTKAELIASSEKNEK